MSEVAGAGTAPLPIDHDSNLIARLNAAIGAQHVSIELADRAFASADLFSDFDPALTDIVLRPGSTAEVSAAVALLSEAGERILPRAAGLSYSGGAVSSERAVVIDVRRLEHVAISAADYYVRVGAGCTWGRLAAALRPHGLRAAHPSPISGSHSTIGGTIAQGITGGMEGVLGLTGVLADGTIARTADHRASWSDETVGDSMPGVMAQACSSFSVRMS